MKTFLNKTKEIDDYLMRKKSPEEALLYKAQLLLDSGLQDTVAWQKQVYVLVKAYSRKKLKTEIEAVHQKLFTAAEHSSFRQRITALFRKP